MKKGIYSARRKLFFLSLMFSVSFVAGIPVIITGFINDYYFWGAFGILMTAAGFYGTPIGWSAYGSMFFKITVFEQITKDKIFSIMLLSATNNRNEKEIIDCVNYLIAKRYLKNYIIDGNKYIIDINDKENLNFEIYARNGDIQSVKCSNCGAVVDISRGFGKCPYCGLFLKDKNN